MSKFSEETKKSISEKMKGNQNGANQRKPFVAMLNRKVLQDPKKLEKIVDKLLDQAQEGEPWAVREVVDRLDGKAVQINEISGPDGNPIEMENANAFANELVAELLRSRQKEQDK